MKATAFEYRHRYLLHTILYALGIVAPWNYLFHLDPKGANAHVWGTLAVDLTQIGVPSIAIAFKLLLILAIASATLGGVLRMWGSAYLGAAVVLSGSMHTAENQTGSDIVEAGPFRYVRNPLYLGTILHTLALALIMPRSGAILVLLAIPLFQLRLILAEEPFLLRKLGQPYLAYCAAVPRLLPSLRARGRRVPRIPRWKDAVLGESYMLGVALWFAVAGWQYNSWLLIQGAIVCFGISLVVRALLPVLGAGKSYT